VEAATDYHLTPASQSSPGGSGGRRRVRERDVPGGPASAQPLVPLNDQANWKLK